MILLSAIAALWIMVSGYKAIQDILAALRGQVHLEVIKRITFVTASASFIFILSVVLLIK